MKLLSRKKKDEGPEPSEEELKKMLEMQKTKQAIQSIRISGKAIAYIVTYMNNTLVLIGRKKFSLKKQTFKVYGQPKNVNPNRVGIFAKTPIYLYDMEHADPLELNKGTLSGYTSAQLEHLFQSTVVERNLSGAKLPNLYDRKTVIMFILLAAFLGFFVGYDFPSLVK